MALGSRPLLVTNNEGWLDFEFRILGHQVLSEDIYGISAAASDAEIDVGFNLLLPRQWTWIEKSPIPHYESSLWIASLGEPSNAFLKRLRTSFGQPESPLDMAQCVEVGAFVLRGSPQNVANEAVAIKLFFGTIPGFHIPYAECFIDVDVPEMKVTLREKDPEYRVALIAGLELGTDNPFA